MALAAQVDDGSDSHREVPAVPPAFAVVYQETFAFVWRTARRLGVVDSAVDDVVQEVFVTVHRRLHQFESRCSVKTWVFSILMGIVRNYRRGRRRKGAAEPISAAVADPDLLEDQGADPLEQATRAQAGRMVHKLLDEMAEDKAIVFVMAELEGLTVPEISELIGTNPNTVYSRLRAGRKEFDQALRRMRASEAENPQ